MREVLHRASAYKSSQRPAAFDLLDLSTFLFRRPKLNQNSMLARFLILLASAATAFAAAIPSHGEGSYTMHPAGSDAAIEYCLAVDGKPSDGSPVVV